MKIYYINALNRQKQWMEIDIDGKYKEEDLLNRIMKYRDTHRFRFLITHYEDISAKNLEFLISNDKLKLSPAKYPEGNGVISTINGLTVKS